MKGQAKATITTALYGITFGNYTLKHTTNSTIIHANNMANYKKAIKRYLDEHKAHYHTYVSNKNYALILRGRQRDQTLEVTEQDLTRNTKVKVMKIFRMKTQAPLFMIVMGLS